MGFTTVNRRASGFGQASRYRTTEPFLFYDNTLGAAAASFDIVRIPQGWRHIRAMVGGESDGTDGNAHVQVQFNGDTAANYAWQEIRAYHDGVTPRGADAIEATASTSALVGYSGEEGAGNEQGMAEFVIPYYANTTFHKTLFAHESVRRQPGATFMATVTFTAYWLSTSAINRLTITSETGNFIAGSRCSVWLEP